MRSKHKKSVVKTRGHKVEKRTYVPIRKYTSSFHSGQRQETNQKECGENSQREGNQSSLYSGGQEDQEKCSQAETSRNTENSEESIHPGPVQALSEMHQESADDETSEKGCIESEELPPWL